MLLAPVDSAPSQLVTHSSTNSSTPPPKTHASDAAPAMPVDRMAVSGSSASTPYHEAVANVNAPSAVYVSPAQARFGIPATEPVSASTQKSHHGGGGGGILGDIGGFVKGVGEGAWDGAKGMGEGVVSVAKGAYHLATSSQAVKTPGIPPFAMRRPSAISPKRQ